jgi:hypothetical protein
MSFNERELLRNTDYLTSLKLWSEVVALQAISVCLQQQRSINFATDQIQGLGGKGT